MLPLIRKAKAGRLTGTATEASEPQRFSPLPITLLLRSAQDAHGLQHGDYKRYAVHCSSRLRRLRTGIDYTCSASKRSSRYAPAVLDASTLIEQAQGDGRFLQISLMEAERAWAQAMDVKEQVIAATASVAADGTPGNAAVSQVVGEEGQRRALHTRHQRRYVRRRLARARVHAQRLQRLCEAAREWVPALTRWDVSAYAAWMGGLSLMERGEQWNVAASHLEEASRVYRALADTLVQVAPARAQPYRDRVTEVDKAARFCRRQAGDAAAAADGNGDAGRRAHHEEALERWAAQEAVREWRQYLATLTARRRLDADASNAAVDEQTAVDAAVRTSWCGHAVVIDHSVANDVAAAAAAAAAPEASTERPTSLLQWYQRATRFLSTKPARAARLYAQCVALTGAALERQPTNDAWRLLDAHLRYQHARAVVAQSAQRGDYGAAQTAARQAMELFGMKTVLYEMLEQDTAYFRMQAALQAARIRWDAVDRHRRANGESPLQQQVSTAVEVYALCSEALTAAASLAQTVSSSDAISAPTAGAAEVPRLSELTPERLAQSTREARALRCQAAARHALALEVLSEQLHSGVAMRDTRSYMVDRLDAYVVTDEVVRLPPPYTPVPSKPFVFDLAADAVRYPEWPERPAAKSGFLSRWFGR